ncbi:hypothetical protein IMF27_20765 [Pseudomonas sp. PCH199]|uniref:hypothetical protein n=1 Tax=unclassified Pseudomonas TaxID=196821 RepID=UPI000BC7AB20|nr:MULTISPECIES: hypothetical protein [unclassified Pseudomonas]MCW8277731.1 hypothetical protein [Pseudomonas sp. PCH199]PAM82126.1 hypothetical protein CES87_21190 [Pseudomonas sp. ERMR1:02]
MKASLHPLYTNEVSPEFLRSLDNLLDAKTAGIATTAGHESIHLALIGSRLRNGDEIIHTLQGGVLYVVGEGVPLADDFLPSNEGGENQ